MNAKELREKLEGMDDDKEVIIENTMGETPWGLRELPDRIEIKR